MPTSEGLGTKAATGVHSPSPLQDPALPTTGTSEKVDFGTSEKEDIASVIDATAGDIRASSESSDNTLFPTQSSNTEAPLAKKIRLEKNQEDYDKTEPIENIMVEESSSNDYRKTYICTVPDCDFENFSRSMAVQHSTLFHGDF